MLGEPVLLLIEELRVLIVVPLVRFLACHVLVAPSQRMLLEVLVLGERVSLGESTPIVKSTLIAVMRWKPLHVVSPLRAMHLLIAVRILLIAIALVEHLLLFKGPGERCSLCTLKVWVQLYRTSFEFIVSYKIAMTLAI